MLWSSGEDGVVLEYDLRCPHRCRNPPRNVLIDLNPHSNQIELKCIDVRVVRGDVRSAEFLVFQISPMRPEVIAVGASDPYVRLFDRRMIKQSRTCASPQSEVDNDDDDTAANRDRSPDNLPAGCATYFVAGHLPSSRMKYLKKFRMIACTYVQFR